MKACRDQNTGPRGIDKQEVGAEVAEIRSRSRKEGGKRVFSLAPPVQYHMVHLRIQIIIFLIGRVLMHVCEKEQKRHIVRLALFI